MSEVTEISQEAKDVLLNNDPSHGYRVSGKNWKVAKQAHRLSSRGVSNSWSKKLEQRKKDEQLKLKLKELKEEKEAEKKARIDKIKEKREKKAETERYERLATVMHAKRVERLKRREKRNKMLKER
ncbi:hypothetical protein CANARDRAFT_22305 [[Candida] arabinofermentans NRRL YB-2248]|uniref:rRNA-processing protein n=1 Tax=[Candida] arabinofermentans NRRL YB-2248 TaxID=983967 RepID=A0A1E4T3S3_9ASCO|nr:hypothetical protein CANARDRAFT_22305 [[Candida] arabinofermentans NRRL YB-2248]